MVRNPKDSGLIWGNHYGLSLVVGRFVMVVLDILDWRRRRGDWSNLVELVLGVFRCWGGIEMLLLLRM